MPPKLSIHPPLLNSASPWATTSEDLRALLLSPSTGAITTRTSLVSGFAHNPAQHRYCFFDAATGEAHPGTWAGPSLEPTLLPPPPAAVVSSPSISSPPFGEAGRNGENQSRVAPPEASLNSLGYSPLPLSEYLAIISSLASTLPPSTHSKTVIISVTGPPQDIQTCYAAIADAARSSSNPFPLAMEINLSCPNISGSPPPAYSAESLAAYLAVLPAETSIPVGIKIPPYTHAGQFEALASALCDPCASEGSSTPSDDKVPASSLSFITATNTLGSCLVLPPFSESHANHQLYNDDSKPDAKAIETILPGTGIGGMAGPPLHPLALGNVCTLRRVLDADKRLSHLDIIGVGGVSDGEGYKRMRLVGASAVALATALGTQGVGVFEAIEKDVGSAW